MLAARMYGARDVRLEEVADPAAPGPGEALIQVTSVGVCGSDLHTYCDGRIGDTSVDSPVILGHEFAGVVIQTGPDALDAHQQPLEVGQRVAVEPATPCWYCELCEAGHPNLCLNHTFHGLWPTDGALQERMICASRNCFPLPEQLNDTVGALLEPLGVAIHAVDLGKLRLAKSVAVLGCGPIGLMVIRLAKLSGAGPIYAFDRYPWRAERALEWGAEGAWTLAEQDPVARVHELTGKLGLDVIFEVAWGAEAIQQAADIAKPGGRLVLVGIPGDDEIRLQHSTARRKGLTIMMARRMKHTYPRAIQLALEGISDLESLVSHRFALKDAGEAFKLNVAYPEGIHKVMIESPPPADVASS